MRRGGGRSEKLIPAPLRTRLAAGIPRAVGADFLFCSTCTDDRDVARVAAVWAEAVELRRAKIPIDRDAMVEDEALAVECAVRETCEVREDAAFQLVYIVVALRFHRDQRLLTADASCAVQQDFLVFLQTGIADVLWKIREVLPLVTFLVDES